MPGHDSKNGNGGKPVPPLPVMRDIRASSTKFRGSVIRPQVPERKLGGQGIEHIAEGARRTASIAMRRPAEVTALLTQGPERDSVREVDPAVKGNTIVPPPFVKEAAYAAQKAQENEVRFLRFANALYRASGIMQENWVNWIADPALLREKIGKAMEFLGERRGENEDYASDYRMMKAFSGMISGEERMNDYLAWVRGKEKGFIMMAQVYANLSMGPLTPYLEVLDACEKRVLAGGAAAADDGFLSFAAMVGDIEEYEGTDYTKGELFKKMFDAWYVRKSGEAMVKVYDLAGLEYERGQALLRAGMLAEQVAVLKQENKSLRASAGSNVSSQVMEEVHKMRAELVGLEGENATLRDSKALLVKEKSSLEKEIAEEKETTAGLFERIRELMSEKDERDSKMLELEGRLNLMENHVEDLRKKNAEFARELALASDPGIIERETMISGMFPAVSQEEGPARQSAAPDLSSMTALKELTGEIARRRSAEREEEPLEGLEEELGDALDSVLPAQQKIVVEESGMGRVRSGQESATAVSMVPAAEATLSEKKAPVLEDLGSLAPFAAPMHPAEEDTGQIDIEREGMLLAEEGPDSGVWATKPGKAVKAIFAYGFAGKGNLPPRPLKMKIEFPPISEKEAYAKAVERQEKEDLRFQNELEEYGTWYNKAGRWVHARRENVLSAAGSVAQVYSRKRRQVQMAAAGAIVAGTVAAIAVGGYMSFGASQRAEEAGMLQKPAVVQVDAPEVEGRGMHGVQAPSEAQEKAPEPLAKPAIADVLAKHGLGELDGKTHLVRFYREMDGVTDVQERYVVLAELLGEDGKLQGYEGKYADQALLGMYGDFLSTAIEYSQLENQAEPEKAAAGEIGEMVAKRLEGRLQQKRVRERMGKERVADLTDAAGQFTSFAAGLPKVAAEKEERDIEVPVVTAEQLQEMKKAGEKPATGVIILPDSSAGMPFDMQKAIDEAIGGEFRVLGTPSKVNDFNRELGRVDDDVKAFLMQAHLSSQLVESGLGESMSNRRVLFMHIDTMNAAVKFAMAEGQGMAAIAEAMNVFDIADGEVKGILAQKRNQGALGESKESVEKNITWLRNRAEELRNRADAYEKAAPVPLPGSPSLNNGNGAPTAIPEKITLDRYNTEAALQMVVFSEHGLSIMEHPLKVYRQMRGMKINNFDRAIILENLADRIMTDSRWMDGLSKTEQFEMLRIMAAYLRTAVRAANEPKNWREDYDDTRIMVGSSALHVSEAVKEIRKLDKADLIGVQAHLRFSIDKATFDELGEAVREFDEQLVYRQRQKLRGVEE